MNNIVSISKGKLLLCSGLLAAALFALHPAFTTPAQAAGISVLGAGGGGGGGTYSGSGGTPGGAGGAGGADLFGNNAADGDPGGHGTGAAGPHAGGDTHGYYVSPIAGTSISANGYIAPSISVGSTANSVTATFTAGGTYGGLSVAAGSGGDDGISSATANGGAGGSATMILTNGAYTADNHVSVMAGNGGNHDFAGYGGGAGGNSDLKVSYGASLTTSGLTEVRGGDGGRDFTGGLIHTNSGTGGDAKFTVDGTFTSEAAAEDIFGDLYNIKVKAGDYATVARGTDTGGKAELYSTGHSTIVSTTNILVANTAGSLATAKMDIDGVLVMWEDRALNNPLYPISNPTFLRIKADQSSNLDGAVTIDIAKLDARFANVSLEPTNDFSSFHVGTAVVSNGWHPTGNILRLDNAVSPDNTDFRVDTVQVLGKGRLEATNGDVDTIGDLNAHGAGLSVLTQVGLAGTNANGATVLTVNRADITNTALSVDDRNGQLGMTRRSDVANLIATDPGGLTANIKHYRTESYQGDLYSLEVRGKNRVELSLTSDVLKAYAEARAANLAFLNQGSDLILSQGFGSALAVTSAPGWKVGTFGAVSGGWSRYDTGSHVDVSGLSMLVGIGVGNDVGPGRLTGAIFFEAGWGTYNSYNTFSNGDVDGDGDTDYYGGGLLARYDFTSDTLKGLYVDFAARVGHTSTDFNTSDIKYTSSIPNWFLGDADFDIDSMYYGLMAGVGYKWSINDKATLDLSAHFMWTHQESDSTDVYFDHVSFEDADSLRTRLGGRFSYAVSEGFSPYIGAYWDYEFDGEAKAKVSGWKVDSPDLEGSTGVGELGLTLKPVADSGFSMDLGVQGYLGVREGVTGSLQLKYEF